MSDYVASDYKVVKLHGSVNWAREVTTRTKAALNLSSADIAAELIKAAKELVISKRYRIIDEREYPIGRDNSATVALFPAIAIPVQTKQDYECPDEHLDVLLKVIPDVTGLLVIGWRAKEQHFLRLLKENLQRKVTAVIVAGTEKDAAETRDVLEHAGIAGAWNLSGAGFSNFVLARRLEGVAAGTGLF